MADAPAPCPRKAIFGTSVAAWMAYISPEFGFLLGSLRDHHDWAEVPGAGPTSWDALADQLRAAVDPQCPLPSVVLFFEAYELLAALGPKTGALARTEVWLGMDDLHWHSEAQHAAKRAAVTTVDLLLSTYAYLLDGMFPEAAAIPRVHMPHAAGPRFLVPFNASPTPRILLSGATSLPWYPHRAHAKALHDAGSDAFSLHAHPGYAAGAGTLHNATGCPYADAIHGHLAAITCGSTLNYAVAKVRATRVCVQMPAARFGAALTS